MGSQMVDPPCPLQKGSLVSKPSPKMRHATPVVCCEYVGAWIACVVGKTFWLRISMWNPRWGAGTTRVPWVHWRALDPRFPEKLPYFGARWVSFVSLPEWFKETNGNQTLKNRKRKKGEKIQETTTIGNQAPKERMFKNKNGNQQPKPKQRKAGSSARLC